MRLALAHISLFYFTFVYGDFFSDIEKLDIDAKLREIDKAISGIDKGDDPVIDKPRAKGRKFKSAADNEDTDDFGSAVEMLAGMFGGGECKFKCKNGNKPEARADHKPTSNGCGSSGIQVDTADIPGMEECCHVHDHCYDTCNSERDACDKAFKTCLHDICNKMKTFKTTTRSSYKDCKTSADLMYGGTVALGCDPFLKAQENACSCRVPQSDSNKISKKQRASKNTQQTSSEKKETKGQTTRRNDEL